MTARGRAGCSGPGRREKAKEAGLLEKPTKLEKQTKKLHPVLPGLLGLDALTELQARIAAGAASIAELDLARRSLAVFREKYRNGNLSARTALRLGLIDAKGKELV